LDAQGGEFQILTLPVFVVVAICCAVAAIPVAVWALMPGDGRSRRQAKANLTRGIVLSESSRINTESPLIEIARRLVSEKNKKKLDHLHALAGRPAAWPVDRLLVLKPALVLVLALLGALLLTRQVSGGLIALTVLISVVGYFVPDLLLYSRGIERQTAIGLELPDTLDQMLIAVEAGLGFEAAMARAGENGKGPLADELIRTLQDMRVGMSRKHAYQALSRRTNVPDLNAFVRAVVQADAYGISISAVLRTQAKEMRVKRRQRAEEKAMQIPVKVLFPLMLFILPVLFIAVLGPTVITVMTNF
jgi:tight adherence protein C